MDLRLDGFDDIHAALCCCDFQPDVLQGASWRSPPLQAAQSLTGPPPRPPPPAGALDGSAAAAAAARAVADGWCVDNGVPEAAHAAWLATGYAGAPLPPAAWQLCSSAPSLSRGDANQLQLLQQQQVVGCGQEPWAPCSLLGDGALPAFASPDHSCGTSATVLSPALQRMAAPLLPQGAAELSAVGSTGALAGHSSGSLTASGCDAAPCAPGLPCCAERPADAAAGAPRRSDGAAMPRLSSPASSDCHRLETSVRPAAACASPGRAKASAGARKPAGAAGKPTADGGVAKPVRRRMGRAAQKQRQIDDLKEEMAAIVGQNRQLQAQVEVLSAAKGELIDRLAGLTQKWQKTVADNQELQRWGLRAHEEVTQLRQLLGGAPMPQAVAWGGVRQPL